MNGIEQIDQTIYAILAGMQNMTLTTIMIVITSFASAVTLILIAVYFFLFSKNKKEGKYVAVNLVIVFLLSYVLKNIFQRPRPSVLHLVEESGYSFPSSHAMVSFAFYGLLIHMAWKTLKNKKAKWAITIGLSLLVVAIGISRVYLGVHHITDVLGGFLFAAIYLALFIQLVYNKKRLDY